MEYFKDKLFPEIFKFILGILAFWIGLVLKKSFEENGSTLFSFSFSPFFDFVLYAVYFLFFSYFSWKSIQAIRMIIISHIDHSQEAYIPPITPSKNITMEKFSCDHKGDFFLFRLRYGHLNRFTPDYLLGISNVRCPNDGCGTELSVNRSYLGYYKYRCPSCKKKYSSKYSQSTLKSHLKKDLDRENEKYQDNLSY